MLGSMGSENQYLWDVLGLGTVVVDHMVTLPRPLEPDMKHEVRAHNRQVGGPVRRPLLNLSEDEKAAVRTAFSDCGLEV